MQTSVRLRGLDISTRALRHPFLSDIPFFNKAQTDTLSNMRPATLYAPLVAILAAFASSSPTDDGELARRDAVLAEFHAMEKRAGEIHARGEDYGWYRK